mgnify:FL=1
MHRMPCHSVIYLPSYLHTSSHSYTVCCIDNSHVLISVNQAIEMKLHISSYQNDVYSVTFI